VNVTLSFAQTPAELRQSLRSWSYLGLVRQSIVGLPVAAVGVVLVAWRITPGAAGGWGVLLTIAGVGTLTVPQIVLIRGQISASRKARTAPTPVEVTLTDDHIGYAQDGYSTQFAWRHVTDVRASASSWIITTRLGSRAIVLPKKAVPTASQPEVTDFLAQWRSRTRIGS
jgi:hypothetical protein